jgi:hypothetical protein
MIKHGLHDCSKDALGYFCTDLDAMISVLKNLRFDDWYETVVLADGAVAGKGVCCFSDGQLGWKSLANLDDCAPFCEATSFFIKCLGAASKSV